MTIRCLLPFPASTGRFVGPTRPRRLPVAVLAGALLAGIPMTLAQPGVAAPRGSEDELPPGVEQLLPRGRIAAVFDPEFVAAHEAGITDDAWILGVVMEGQARAYSLNLLNRHEVVNDSIGDKNFAAVW